MKVRIAMLATAFFMSACFAMAGCETHHEESTRQNFLGGTTHEESTTVHNPITGQDSTEHSKQVTH